MAYVITLPPRHYKSWDESVDITQEIQSESKKLQTRISISSKDSGLNSDSDWVDYPFKDGQTLSDLIFETVPAMKQKSDFLPIVETTRMSEMDRKPLFTDYVLKDKTTYRVYLPIKNVLKDFRVWKSTPSDFQLSDGERIRTINPEEVIEILQ